MPDSRICVDIAFDPETAAIVAKSGEPVDANWQYGIASTTAGAIQTELSDRDPALYEIEPDRGSRVLVVNEQVGSLCTDHPDNIHIEHRLERGLEPLGYRVSLEAKQRDRTFLLAITRSHTIKVPMEIRSGIAEGADVMPSGQPFWDVSRDSDRLTKVLVQKLLEEMKL